MPTHQHSVQLATLTLYRVQTRGAAQEELEETAVATVQEEHRRVARHRCHAARMGSSYCR